jgi:hypothetical protein
MCTSRPNSTYALLSGADAAAELKYSGNNLVLLMSSLKNRLICLPLTAAANSVAARSSIGKCFVRSFILSCPLVIDEGRRRQEGEAFAGDQEEMQGDGE